MHVLTYVCIHAGMNSMYTRKYVCTCTYIRMGLCTHVRMHLCNVHTIDDVHTYIASILNG